MKKICQILTLLAIGTVFFFLLIWLGIIVTFAATAKSAYELAWIVGAFYVPLFLGGFMLSRVKVFRFPYLLVPLSAFLALLTVQLLRLSARDWDRMFLFDPMFYLAFLAVPLAYAGHSTASLFFGKNELRSSTTIEQQ